MMFLLDANLSPRLVDLLKNHYPGITHVGLHGLLTASDAAIWDFAARNEAVVITCDRDFLTLSSQHDAPPRVLHVRAGGQKTDEIAKILIDTGPAIMAWCAGADSRPLILRPEGTLSFYKRGKTFKKQGLKRRQNRPPTPPPPGG